MCVRSAWKGDAMVGTAVSIASFFSFIIMASASASSKSLKLSGMIDNDKECVEGDSLTVNKGIEGTFSKSGTGSDVRISSGMGSSFFAIDSSKILARRSKPSFPNSSTFFASRAFSFSASSFDISAEGFPNTAAIGLSRMYIFIKPCQYEESTDNVSASSSKGKAFTSACKNAISSCGEIVAPSSPSFVSPARGPYMKLRTIPSTIAFVGLLSDASSSLLR
mmetsp:Transcript_18718/g.39100  ORF Transcript_18718/g.39100 Transcript_18718/m.39100 type:complete len:221 (+) Transcript_18718:291-953(+)